MAEATESVTLDLPGEVLDRVDELARFWHRSRGHTLVTLVRCGLGYAQSMEPVCRDCGCTYELPCMDPATGEPCAWADIDLCTVCARRAEADPRHTEHTEHTEQSGKETQDGN